MKMVLMVVAVVAVSCSCVSAASWKYLGSHGTSHYFLKPKTLQKKENIASAWVKKEDEVPAGAKLDSDEFVGARSDVAFQEFDCAASKVRDIIGSRYLRGDRDADITQSPWRSLAAGDQIVFRNLCGGGLAK